ncbi:MAG: DNA polymerase Y family protein [Phycisphaerales bacterium]
MTLLIETAGQREVVAHACPRAVEAGIRRGMPVAAARAAMRGDALVIEPHDAQRTRQGLRGLALWLHRFSPVVAEEDDEGIVLDIAGCEHLFGGARSMAVRVRESLGRMGIASRVAIASTFAGARAIARFGREEVALVEDEPRGEGGRASLIRALEPLPARALFLDALTLDGLAEVNIRRVGDLLVLPRAAVSGRFGEAVLRALDGATGRGGPRRREVLDPIRPREPTRVEEDFDGPCASLEGIGLACRGLLERLCALLDTRGQGVIDWVTTLHRSDLAPVALIFRHCAPSREARHLWRLLEPRLERVHLGFGVEGVTVAARAVKAMPNVQRTLWRTEAERDATDGAPSGASDLIDALVNRLGKDAVLRAELAASHVPERSLVMRSVLERPRARVDLPAELGDRPTRLFAPALMARVIALHPEGPVSRIEWRGGEHRVADCLGPERIKGEWWRGERLMRDYFKVRDEHGQWLWLYRDVPQGQWFVQGIWS